MLGIVRSRATPFDRDERLEVWDNDGAHPVKAQRIVKVRDLLATQQRITVLCACGHWTSISELDARAMDRRALALITPDNEFPCAHCPDPAPEELRRDKSATQLWKEAGEP